jgi:hypothetical protein
MAAGWLTYQVVDPQTLNAAVTLSSRWVPVLGARMVTFWWKSTNANGFQNAAQPAEGSNMDPGVAGGGGWQANAANITPPTPAIGGFEADLFNGYKSTVAPLCSATLYQPVFTVRWIRMNVLGHATLNITGVQCVAMVYYDDLSLAPVGAVAV